MRVECNYLGNIEYDDELEGQVSINKIGNSSFALSFCFLKENIMVAKGALTNVFIDRSTGKAAQVPDVIRAELIKHLEPISL